MSYTIPIKRQNGEIVGKAEMTDEGLLLEWRDEKPTWYNLQPIWSGPPDCIRITALVIVTHPENV